MAEFKLYCFGESGNAYKAALMLQLCGLDWEPIKVEFFKGQTRSPEYIANVNAMGEVPVLQHKGKSLTQSGVILDYLATLTGKFGWNNIRSFVVMGSKDDPRAAWSEVVSHPVRTTDKINFKFGTIFIFI